MTRSRLSAGPVVAVLALVLALVVALTVTAAVGGYAVGKESGNALIKKGSLSGNRLKDDSVKGSKVDESSLATVPRAALANSVPPPTVTAFVFAPQWQQNPQDVARVAGWRKDASGFVHLQGNVVGDDVESLVVTLPVGARPVTPLAYTALGEGGISVVVVETDGEIRIVSGGLAFVSLDGISFYPGG